MARFNPIGAGEFSRDEFRIPHNTSEIEQLKLLVLGSGAYRDLDEARGPVTRLTALTQGTKVAGGARIRGGRV